MDNALGKLNFYFIYRKNEFWKIFLILIAR